MTDRYYIGWVRESTGKGNVKHRPRKSISNAITTFCGGAGYYAQDGLAPTTPHIVYEFE